MQLVRTILDLAVANGLNIVRFFAFAVSPEYALQPSPGQYSEAIFKGLDYALDQLRSRGLKVLLAATQHVHRFLLVHKAACMQTTCTVW